MKVEPGAADLLATARTLLLEEVAPALAASQRYAVLMVANALAIAGREFTSRPTAQDELARLRALLGDWTPTGNGEADLRDATAQLAARIRQDQYVEDEARARLLAHLRETTRARLAVSNPKALAG
jgi:hypothetical protein